MIATTYTVAVYKEPGKVRSNEATSVRLCHHQRFSEFVRFILALSERIVALWLQKMQIRLRDWSYYCPINPSTTHIQRQRAYEGLRS